MRHRACVMMALISLGCAPAPAGPPPDGWRVVTVPGQAVTRFVAQPDGAIRVTADRAVGFLLADLPDTTDHRLTWRWRVDAAPPPTPPDAVGRDDRPLAVHVIFAKAGDDDRFLGGLRRWMRGALTHEAFAGRTITYMWGGTLPAGTRLINPYLPKDGRIIVLRDGTTPLGEWRTESVDPIADYQSLFGGSATPTHLSLSADTEDSLGCASAMIVPPAIHHEGTAR